MLRNSTAQTVNYASNRSRSPHSIRGLSGPKIAPTLRMIYDRPRRENQAAVTAGRPFDLIHKRSGAPDEQNVIRVTVRDPPFEPQTLI